MRIATACNTNLIDLWWLDFFYFSLKFLNRKYGRYKTIDQWHLCLKNVPTYWKNYIKWMHSPWVITCLRKRGRVSLGKNWTKQCSGTMLKTNMLLQYFKKKKRSLVIFPSGSLESLQRPFFYFLKIAKENSNLFMVMLSIRMMGWKWRYHLGCYFQQKKN